MRKKQDLVLILGTGYMASVYFSHFNFLKENCLMVYRKKDSNNYLKALKRFGGDYLISQKDALNFNPKIVISCVSPESHLVSIEPFIHKTDLIAVEKPPSLDMNFLSNYSFKNKIRVLMNRRYYHWVNNIFLKAKESKIRKIIANIPEQLCSDSWYGIPKNIATNSIHIFDLIHYITNGLNKPVFSKINKKSAFIFTNSKLVEEIFFQLNYDSIERFNIKFYLKDNSLIECSPVEKAHYYNEFEIQEATKDDYIRKYIPKKIPLSSPKREMDFQKPGVLEICKDLLKASKFPDTFKLCLPDIEETFNIMSWIKNSFSK